MQTLEKEVYGELESMAAERGVTIQEFLRAVVVPDWIRMNGTERRMRFRQTLVPTNFPLHISELQVREAEALGK